MYTSLVSKETLPLLTVQINFEETLELLSNATIYITIFDVTMADAPSKMILQRVIRNIDYNSNLQFRIYGQIPNKKARYSVRVHVDVDGDGKVSTGDFISMESYPILTYDYPNYVSVKVKLVK